MKISKEDKENLQKIKFSKEENENFQKNQNFKKKIEIE